MSVSQVEHSNTGVDRQHFIPSLRSSGARRRLSDHDIIMEAPTSLGISTSYLQPDVPSEGHLYNEAYYYLDRASGWDAEMIWAQVALRLVGLTSRRSRAMQDIEQLAVNCQNDNWDGEGADRVSSETVKIAREFIGQLCEETPLSDLYIDATPHGSISFEWVPAEQVMLDVLILPSGEIAYAYLIRGDEGSGRDQWQGTIPKSIVEAVDKVFPADR